MRKKIIFIIFIMIINLLVFSIYLAYADPVVSSISGVFNHKSTVIINGSNFGLKSPAAPLYWDDMEDKIVDNPSEVINNGGFSSVWSNASCGDWRPMYKNSNSYRWITPPHFRSTKILGGGHRDNFPVGQDCRNVMVTVDGGSGKKIWYGSWYTRLSNDFPKQPAATGQSAYFNATYIAYLSNAINNTQSSLIVQGQDYERIGAGDVLMVDSEKMKVTSRIGTTVNVTRGYMGTTALSHTTNARIYWRGWLYNIKVGSFNQGASEWSGYNFQFYGLEHHTGAADHYDMEPLGEGGGIRACSGCTLNGGLSDINNTNDAHSEWKHVEVVYHDSSRGWAKSYVDNIKSKDCICDNATDELNNSYDLRSMSFGTYFRYFYPEDTNTGIYHLNDNAWTYLDDIYVDNTFSRVVLTNNATYINATIVEPQIPSTWNSNSITATVNLGKLGYGTAYLFVFDANNIHNAVGYPVTIGGVPPDTVLPAPPSNLRIQ